MKKRILVVEDEEKLRRVLELQLMSAGFEVDKAASAEEGLKLVDRAAMVLTDLKLPHMDVKCGFLLTGQPTPGSVGKKHFDIWMGYPGCDETRNARSVVRLNALRDRRGADSDRLSI